MGVLEDFFLSADKKKVLVTYERAVRFAGVEVATGAGAGRPGRSLCAEGQGRSPSAPSATDLALFAVVAM
jgi:hypothetical protein